MSVSVDQNASECIEMFTASGFKITLGQEFHETALKRWDPSQLKQICNELALLAVTGKNGR